MVAILALSSAIPLVDMTPGTAQPPTNAPPSTSGKVLCPCRPNFLKILSKTNAILGIYPTSSKIVIIAKSIKNKNTPQLIIGNNVQINDYVHLSCANSLIIGDNVLIASKVYISDLNHGNYSFSKDFEHSNPEEIAKERRIFTKPVKICENVWLGENVSVLPGTVIGKNSIIGANSVVSKNIPENCIAVGNPAKVIKKYNFETKKWEKI